MMLFAKKSSKTSISPVLLLLIGAIFISFAPIFVKLSEVPPTVSAWYRVLFGGSILLLWGFVAQGSLSQWQNPPIQAKLGKDTQHRSWILWCGGAGLFFAIDLGLWHQAIIYSGAGISTFLANLNVFYLTFFGIIFFRESLSFRYLICTAGALIGSLLLIDLSAWEVWSQQYTLGIVFGFLSGLAYTGFILCLRKAEAYSQTLKLPSPLTLGLASFATAGFLGILAWLMKEPLALDLTNLLILLALALIAQVGGWSLITRSLPQLNVSISGLLLLLQPVLASFWAWMIFDESWNIWQIVGAALTIFCIYAGNLEMQSRQLSERSP